MNTKRCGVAECERPHYGKGLCHTHWMRLRRTGSTGDTVRSLPREERWRLRVSKTESCWLWTGHIDKGTGYGKFSGSWAHRVAYEQAKGPIPDGLWIDHLCRNRACVNPDHLEAVPPRVNSLRGASPTWTAHRTGVCKRGHSLEDAYLAHRSDGRVTSRCRTCARERENARYRKRQTS